MKERRYELDWLRVIATLGVFVYHSALLFNAEPWLLKNAEQSLLLFKLQHSLLRFWLMEIFSLAAGAAAWHSLRSRSAGVYLRDRVKRLLIPLYTVGLFVLLPPQFYFDLVTNEGYTGTFWSSLPRYFHELSPPSLTSPDTVLPLPFAGQLWFLQYLFLTSLVTLPLLLYLRSQNGQRWIGRLAGWAARPVAVFLFVVPLALVLILLRGQVAGPRTWGDWLYYTLFFLAGYVMAADRRLADSAAKSLPGAAILWMLAVAVEYHLVWGLHYDLQHPPVSPLYVLYETVVATLGWSAVVTLLGLAARFLNRSHRLLPSLSEAVLPFYVFHQTIILWVGSFVIRWDLRISQKLFIVMAVSFPLILGLYALLVRPFNGVRFLFGMRPRERPARG